jgi:hypothetical protein
LAHAVALLCAAMAIVVTPRAGFAQISPGPLARAHASLDGSLGCASCHAGRKETTTQRCLACHREIEWLRMQGRGLHARGGGRGTCSSCHPDHAGRDFQLIQWPSGSPERFDHEGGAGYALEQSHATLKCASCHRGELRVSQAATLSKRKSNAGWVGLERDCASCHTDPHRGSLEGACTSCHDIDQWKDAPRFNHAESRYPLTGKHASVACAKCHLAPRLRPTANASGQLVAVLRPVAFSDCSSCHSDPHRGQMKVACSRCHETSSFKTIDRKAFDHDRTRYPLRGRHAAVPCASCHSGPANTSMKPAFGSCASCHADPHRTTAALMGKAQDCASCHRVEGFKPASLTDEQHRKGTCAVCHADAHGGQLSARNDRGACGSCHDVGAWRPSTFVAAAHATLRVPLDGAHARVTCAACHGAERRGLRPLPAGAAGGTARVALHPPETTCGQCHTDPHAWRNASAVPSATACASCHATRDFRGTSIDADRHATFGYRLEGAHRAVPCTACHSAIARPRSGSTLVAAPLRVTPLDLGGAPTTCASCHADPHRGQFAKLDGGSCDRCHTMSAFKPAGRFDHGRDAGLALDGAHARVACAACHRQTTTGKPGDPLVYGKLSSRCESCHTTARRPGDRR